MSEPRPERPRRGERADLEAADRDLVDAALAARDNAHAPYSGFAVGAAVRTARGAIVRGCNVEISSYGLTECAERVALFAAKAAGAGEIVAVAVCGPGHGGRPTPPCGACRQVIWDLAGDVPVLLSTPEGAIECWRSRDLLPAPFDPEHLRREEPEP